METEKRRLFVALRPLPVAGLFGIARQLDRNLGEKGIRYVSESNMHLTLKFIGETPIERISSVAHVLGSLAPLYRPFTLIPSGVGFAGAPKAPKIIWTEFGMIPELTEIHLKINDELAHLGFRKEIKRFVPHITLGRIKSLVNRSRFQTVLAQYKHIKIDSMTADTLLLYESILTPDGPIYKVIEHYKLG